MKNWQRIVKDWKKTAALLGVFGLLAGVGIGLAAQVYAQDGSPEASAPAGKNPVKEYTRVHPKTGLVVKVRSYLRREAEPKPVAVRSHLRRGKRVKGYERQRPNRP